MIRENGNMWDIWDLTDKFIFTGNSTVKRNGALVMGRGIAREVRDRFTGIDLKIGNAIKFDVGQNYGFLEGSKICVFQVKHHWGNPASLQLVRASVAKMRANVDPTLRYDMNFPAIGNGGLSYNEVYPLIKELPDNVHIWTFK